MDWVLSTERHEVEREPLCRVVASHLMHTRRPAKPETPEYVRADSEAPVTDSARGTTTNHTGGLITGGRSLTRLKSRSI